MQAQPARRGASLVFEGAFNALYDTNARQDQTELELYGGSLDLLARFADRPVRPILQLEYGAGRRASTPTTVHDVLTQRAAALLAVPLTAGLRVELIARGVTGGVDEDLNRQREASVLPRLEWELGRRSRFRLYGNRSWRDEGSDPTLALGSMLGAEYRHRFGSAATIQLGFRDEAYTPSDSVYGWRRDGVTADLAVRTGARSAIEFGARYRDRRYPHRLLTIGDQKEPRRDDERRGAIAWVFRNRTGTELRAGYEYEIRTSNDVRRDFDAHRIGLSFRQTVARWGGQANTRFDEDRWDLTVQPAAALSFDQVTTAGSSVCGISAGRAHCWTGSSATPPRAAVAVRPPDGDSWLQLAAGQTQVCALTKAGEAYCWHLDGNGQPTALPAAIRGTGGFRAVVVGYEHACALDAAGAAFCWGANRDAALGNGSLGDSHTPTAVAGGHRFRSLAAGERHTCGITASGDVYCWGSNAQQQLGRPHGQRFAEPQPVAVPRLLTITAGTSHTCGLDSEGGAWCWGENGRGQLGIGFAGAPAGPARVSTDARLSLISAGWAHTCALSTDGRAFCWGQNRYGQLGIPADELSHDTPLATMPDLRFSSLSASFRTCGITDDARVSCWGADPAPTRPAR